MKVITIETVKHYDCTNFVLFIIYLDCTSPFVVKFSTSSIAQDTKATATDQDQRGIFFCFS